MKSRFLEGLGSSERTIVLAAAARRYVPAKSLIASQGEPANHLFLVTKGCAHYFYITPEGKKIVLFWVPAGEIVGGAALLSKPSDYLVSAETVKDSHLLVWPRHRIRALALQFPPLLDNALSVASDYLTWYLAAHMNLVCHDAAQRVAQVLVALAHGLGCKVPGGLSLELTNEQLASAANVTPFTVSRLLSKWHRDGALVKSRKQILLRSPEGLFVSRFRPA